MFSYFLPKGAEDPNKKLSTSDILLAVFFLILWLIIIVWILQAAWNSSIPKMFDGARKIDYSMALGLLVVSLILFPRL